MRYAEIIFKVLFFITAIYFIATQQVLSPSFNILLIVSIVLGLILMLNRHHPSYKFKHTKHDYALRSIEGGFLIIFAVISAGFGL
jgi:hypothetical protein